MRRRRQTGTVPDELERICPRCGWQLIVVDDPTRPKKFIACSNEECMYEEDFGYWASL